MAGDQTVSIITLDAKQYQHYKKSCVTVCAPDGNFLEAIGNNIHTDEMQTSRYKLRDDVHLVSQLLCHINQNLDLTPQAVSGLADLFFRTQDFCDKYVEVEVAV
jgi:hypothetical protein